MQLPDNFKELISLDSLLDVRMIAEERNDQDQCIKLLKSWETTWFTFDQIELGLVFYDPLEVS